MGLEERPDAITNPLSEILEIGDDSPQPFPEGTKVIDIFDQIGTGRTLLILGEPGSGKTTTLLELARDLIGRAEQDTNQLIPVVFNLSSWAKKRQTIAHWLVEELNTLYQVPNKIAQALVTQQQLLPLLDGLDEVKADYRDDCILALNKFNKDYYNGDLVVCSRIKDYQTLSNRLNFQKGVCIRLLTLEKIYHYLDSVGDNLTVLRTLIAEDTVLQQLAQSPLMLHIMTLAYQGVAVEDLPKTEVIEERRKQLFNAYIEKMFKRRKTNQQYKKAQVKHWLIWMAQRMVEESQTVFLIEKMQPYWLKNRKQKQTYILMLGLMLGLMGVLIGGLIGVLIRGLDEGLMFALMLGLMGVLMGLMGGLMRGLRVILDQEVTEEIKTVEILQINWKKILIYLLIFGLIGGLMEGLIFGLIGGLIFGLMEGLREGLEISEIETKTTPNQGIRKSARNAITVALVFGLVFGLMFGLAGWLRNGGEACIKHFSLRLILYRNNYIPWNYARFLDYAADRILLQKVGGGYIFIHRMLMEHFADMKLES